MIMKLAEYFYLIYSDILNWKGWYEYFPSSTYQSVTGQVSVTTDSELNGSVMNMFDTDTSSYWEGFRNGGDVVTINFPEMVQFEGVMIRKKSGSKYFITMTVNGDSTTEIATYGPNGEPYSSPYSATSSSQYIMLSPTVPILASQVTLTWLQGNGYDGNVARIADLKFKIKATNSEILTLGQAFPGGIALTIINNSYVRI